jgi:multidrug efflux system membrane fusion protein
VKKQQLVAVGVLILVVIWMVIPHEEDTIDPAAIDSSAAVVVLPEGSAAPEDPTVFSVRAQRVAGQPYVEQVRVRGRTQAFRHVEVRAEQAGRVVEVPVPRGARVSAGDVLCEIAVDTRDVDLLEARSRREQAQFEYDAALDLQARGLQSDVAVAQLKAALESSRAQVARAELALKNTEIVAPFDGVVETRTVEVGDLLNIGSVCASVLDDSPMMLVGMVPEQDVNRYLSGQGCRRHFPQLSAGNRAGSPVPESAGRHHCRAYGRYR